MPDAPGILTSRRRAAGNLPGMAPPSTGAAPSAAVPEPSDARRRSETAKKTTSTPKPPARPPSRAPRTNKAIGFGGAQKVGVSTRTYRPLWDAYADLADELTREGRGRVFQNDLINAVLAACLPVDAAAARTRLAEYRALLEADPPRDLRTLS